MSDDELKRVKVWDGPTRLFHWGLVVLFALSTYSAFQDKFGIYANMHLFSGVAIIALLVWRILWGFVGSETSRFSHFVRGPKATANYCRDAVNGRPTQEIGHNPLGAISVCLMLFLLLAQAVMGLFASDAMFFYGPFSDSIDGGLSGDLTGIHKLLGYGLLGLVALHILAILLYRLVRSTDLLTPMITGWKRVSSERAVPLLASPWRAVLLFSFVAATAWWGILA